MSSVSDVRMAQLEMLVDELVKAAPLESRIRTCMENVGLTYIKDPVVRMNTVLAALDRVRAPERRKDRGL